MPTILAEARGLSKDFPVKGKKGALLHGVSQVDLQVYEGETLALVGESGCGKSTLGRLLLGLIPPTEGQVLFDGQDLAQCAPKELRALRRQMQMVFQDTAAALNPRWDVGEILAEPLRIHKLCPPREFASRAEALLERVGLPRNLLGRYPHELSGGQRQRVGIARALAVEPRLVVCDEPVSALDVSVQAQMLNLLLDLQADEGLTYVLVSHDLSVVRHSAGRVCVMFLGRVCEIGPTEEVFTAPRHPYTKLLLAAVPRPDPTQRNENGPPVSLIGRKGAPPLTEQEFIQQAEGLKGRLYRTAWLYLGSEACAVDAVDEAVYQGFLHYKRLRQPEYFATWMTRILINACNAELRRRKRELAVAELPETAAEAFDALPLREAVARLPRELRAVVVLRYFQGLTLAETAQALDIPPGTVSTRQRKALSLLKLHLTEEV